MRFWRSWSLEYKISTFVEYIQERTSQLQSSQWLWSRTDCSWRFALRWQLNQKGELFFSYQTYFRPIRRLYIRFKDSVEDYIQATCQWECNSVFSVISEECEDPLLKRMWQCAEKGRNEIVDLISFKCFEIGKRGPCSEGELFFLNRDSDVSLSMLWLCQSCLSFLVFCSALHQKRRMWGRWHFLWRRMLEFYKPKDPLSGNIWCKTLHI